MTTDIARLEEICDRSLQAVGYELVDVEYVRDQHGWVLRVFIDHPSASEPAAGGPAPTAPARVPPSRITHQDCEVASRHLGTVLDVEDLIPNAYRLEVSSPGVRRPIRKERDFVRFMGHTVRLQLQEPVQGRKNFVGRLLSAGAGQVGVEVDGQVFQLPLASIKRARLEVAF